MLTSRRTAKMLAAITAVALVAPTAASAHCPIHGSFGGFSRPQAKYSAAKSPVRTASVKPAPKASKPAQGYRVATQTAKPVAVAAAAPASAPARAPTCLTKEYLDTGAVKFQDTCTKEWAVNSTDVEKKTVTPATTACLTKESSQSGVIMFRDTCTNEWAMNTLDKLADASASR